MIDSRLRELEGQRRALIDELRAEQRASSSRAASGHWQIAHARTPASAAAQAAAGENSRSIATSITTPARL